jgi:hypothetical protein
MASVDRYRSLDPIRLEDRGDHDGLLMDDPQDPAGCAGRVVAEEVLSILQAVDARRSEIDEARREADDNRLAVAHARASLAAMARELEALATELERTSEQRGDGD